jgi:hypothetical protein
MGRRPLRAHFSYEREQRMMKSLKESRRLVIDYGCASDFHSERRAPCDALHRAIEEFAQHMTGDAEYFWLKPHSTPRSVSHD